MFLNGCTLLLVRGLPAMDVGDKINELHEERVHGCKHDFSKPVPGYEHEGGTCLHCGINEVYYLSNKDKFPK